jgi:hypothetical protein
MRLVGDGLVWTHEVVEVEGASQVTADLSGRTIIVQLHLLVLDRALEPFGEDMLQLGHGRPC